MTATQPTDQHRVPTGDLHRFTMTITPISDDEMQRIIDLTRDELGRGPLIHVIGKQHRSTHIGEAPCEWIEQRNAALEDRPRSPARGWQVGKPAPRARLGAAHAYRARPATRGPLRSVRGRTAASQARLG